MPLKTEIKILFRISLFTYFIHRNLIDTTPRKFIDVRKDNFCKYLGPIRKNYLFFDYYEYHVHWNADIHPPIYLYWNISCEKIQFITDNDDINDDKFKVANKKIIKGAIF